MEEKETIGAARETAQGADARKEEGAADARIGKFKSVDALLNAYNSLEAEFTRRSQRLRELEARAQNNEGTGTGETGMPAPREGSAPDVAPERAGGVSDDVRKSVIAEYLASVSAGAPVVMAGGGTHVSAPESKARTIEEAGALAARLLQNKG